MMTQTVQNVVVCVTGNTAADAVFSPPSPKCTINGVIGYPVVVKAYLSDQPISGDGSSGGGACTNPFSMSAEDGGLLSAAIVGCWAAAYFVRSVINVVKNGVES
jgi:hypothetical protein